MKIVKVETFKYWITWCNWLFIKVTTDEGVHGWGEGSLHGQVAAVETVIHDLKSYLIGKDPTGIEAHWQAMYRSSRWRHGPVLSTALSAIDIALWDIEGKRLGVPVYRLLGGPTRTKLPVYASHWLESAATPEEAVAGAVEAVRRGFTAFKWRPFRSDALRANEAREIDHGAALMAAARDAVGPFVEIFVECAEQFSPRSALRAADALLPYRPGFLEEPIPFENPGAMIQLQRDMPLPIACGERLISRWDVAELLRKGGCRILQPDVMHCGGITEARKIASLADLHYVQIAPHNPAGPICNLASMHLAASIPNFYMLEQMEAERSIRDRVCTRPVEYLEGFFHLPTEPGLGTDLDLSQLDEFAFRPQPIAGSIEQLWH